MKTNGQAGRVTPCAPPLNVRAAARRGLTRPTNHRAEFRAWQASLPAGMERDTLLMPDAIAESVCQEVSRFLDLEMPERYAVWLAAKAHRCYSAHRHFYKLMQASGNLARDRLYMFMRHWLANILYLERQDLIYCLPIEFSRGNALPRGAYRHIKRVSYLAHFLPAPRDWQPSRVTRHHRWSWLKQIETAGVTKRRHCLRSGN
jgi:hypothetical protein